MTSAVLQNLMRPRAGLQRILANAGWLAMDRIIRLGIGLVVGAWVARYLGPYDFGLLNYALAFVALVGTMGTWSANNIIIRDLVNAPDEAGETLGTAFVLRLLGAVFVVAASTIFVLVAPPDDPVKTWLILIVSSACLLRSFDVVGLVYEAQVRSKVPVIARSIVFAILSGVKVLLILAKAPIYAFALTEVLHSLLNAVAMAVAYRLDGPGFSAWRFSAERTRRMVSDSWPLLLSGIAIMVYMRVDQVMIEGIAGPEALGVFSAAVRVSEVWYFIPTALVASVFPSILQLKRVNEALYYRRLQQLFSLMAGISLAIAVPMTFLSGTVVQVLYGARFAGAGPLLSMHIWATFFVFMGVAQEPWNISEGLTRLSLYRTIAGAVVNILLNVVLIPRHGAMGAAIATFISFGLSAVVGNLFNAATRRIFFMQARSLLFPMHLMTRT